MKKPFQRLFTFVSVFISILFVVFAINQTAQLVQLASLIHPIFGKIVLYTLLSVYILLIVIPIYVFIRLPKPLRPPSSEKSPEFDKYLVSLQRRLRSNPQLQSLDLEIADREQVVKSLNYLEKKTNDIIRETASTIFISTAISQSGRLDAFVVFAAQARMVWRISRIYNQRPSPRELTWLYGNVVSTSFLALELDDVDIEEQIEPIVTNVIGGSLASIVPGANAIATFITNSILDGAANAYLTLRIGAITKQYCGSLIISDKKSIRRFASAEAAKMLGEIVLESAGKVSKAIWDAAKKKASSTSLSKLNPFKHKFEEEKDVEKN